VRSRRIGAAVASGCLLVVVSATALWNHAPAMLDRIDQSSIPYPIFQPGEVADLVGYLGATADVSR
jgi:hypothetical protein